MLILRQASYTLRSGLMRKLYHKTRKKARCAVYITVCALCCFSVHTEIEFLAVRLGMLSCVLRARYVRGYQEHSIYGSCVGRCNAKMMTTTTITAACINPREIQPDRSVPAHVGAQVNDLRLTVCHASSYPPPPHTHTTSRESKAKAGAILGDIK